MQRLELLLVNPEFQELIHKFRKLWNIPLTGLTNEHDALSKWWYNLLEKTDAYLDEMEKGKEWQALKEERITALKNGKGSLAREIEAKLKGLNRLAPLNDFKNSIDQILKQFQLSKYYRDTMEAYLIGGKFTFLKTHNVGVVQEYNKEKNGKLLLEIYPETTMKDVQVVWSIVESLQKKLHGYKDGRRRSIVNFERDKRIFELHNLGKSHKEIAYLVNEELQLKPRLSYADVGKILARFKRKLRDT